MGCPGAPGAPRSGSDIRPVGADPVGDAALPGLRLQLLGCFRVWVGDREVDNTAWPRHKPTQLLKLLALAPGHQLHREQVFEQLWPDLAPAAAANNLHTALYFLRRVLAPEGGPAAAAYLRLRDQQLRLCPAAPLWVDVEVFEAAAAAARRRREPAVYQAAIARYGGDLLPDEPYADWLGGRREALRRTYLTLLMELARLHEAARELDRAIAALRRVVGHEASHEAAHVGLMRLYVETGQRTEALRQYQQLREALLRELDATPDPATQRLYRAIFTGQFPPRRAVEPGSAPADRDERARRPRHNLPQPLTTFIGREQAIAEVNGLLRTTRLLTLTGAGGSGKTRLALEVAAEPARSGAYPDGVWLVELAALRDGDLMPQALAAVLGIREQPGRPLLDTLVEALRSRAVLLLLDNCEHLLEPCVRLADTLLRAAPHVRILATSRQALGVLGEAVFRVPALSLPAPPTGPATDADPTMVAELAASEAAQLFLDRARLVQPAFALTVQNAGRVAAICRQLDGLPLAIELAAARVRTLGVETLAARLGDRFRLLNAGNRAAPQRHQTLRGAIEWSYELLDEPERRLFQRLAVFAGGFTLEAAEAICGDEEDPTTGERDERPEEQVIHPPAAPGPGSAVLSRDAIVEVLGRLVDKSLVLPQPGEEPGEPGRAGVRYQLLETLREYAQERLQASRASSGAEPAEVIRSRHAEYYLALAEAAAPKLRGGQQLEWLGRLEAEHDNLRAALGWSLARGQRQPGLQLAGALGHFWEIHGHLSEGRRWLEQALRSTSAEGPTGREALGDRPPARDGAAESPELAGWRTRALQAAGRLARLQGDYARATALHEASLALCRERGDARGAAEALDDLGVLASDQGDYARAVTLFEASLALCRELGDEHGIARTLNNLGRMAHFQGNYGRAAVLFEESAGLCRQLGDAYRLAIALGNLASAVLYQGDAGRAGALYEASLALHRELGDRQGIARLLNNLGWLAHTRRDHERAGALFAESLALRRELGDQPGMATTITNLALTAHQQGNDARAVALLQESLALYRELGDRRGIAGALGSLGVVAMERGDQERARALYEESLALSRQLGDQPGIARTLNNLGWDATLQGDWGRAATLLARSLAVSRAVGDKALVATTLCNLGWLASDQGELERAKTLQGESLALYRQLGDTRGIACCLRGLARVAGAQEQPERAARLFGAADALADAIGARLSPAERTAFDRQLAAVRARLGEAAFAAAWAAGRTMSLEAAVAEAEQAAAGLPSPRE